ncbi:MAG: hypothetical protein AAGK32_07745 [Actinomycetota bacterium]
MSAYDGPASIVTSAGDSFAECHLVAEATDDGWTGKITEILWRTQMVPSPLNAQENLRIEDLDGKPVSRIDVLNEADGEAQVKGSDDFFA